MATRPETGLAASARRSDDTEPGGAPQLPEPSGPHPVGTTSIPLRDTSRPDPWADDATARELMVSLWYPAEPSDGPRAAYLTPKESELLLTHAGVTGLPLDVLSRTRTNARTGAAPITRRHELPLVVLSPGFTKPRAVLTSVAEDLASNGYVVAGIEHTYESAGTSFPDGRVTTCLAGTVRRDQAFWAKLTAGRAADVSFVLDELTGPSPSPPGAGLIDSSRIAMAGHSVGGASAIATMLTDPRVRAGIDIDGSVDIPIPADGLSRPVLFLGRRSQYSPGSGAAAATWEHTWPRLTGWKRWLLVAGAEHPSFTDVALLAEQCGLGTRAELSGARASRITRAYVRAFVDQQLGNTPQPLLYRPSAHYPEVTFCSPASRA